MAKAEQPQTNDAEGLSVHSALAASLTAAADVQLIEGIGRAGGLLKIHRLDLLFPVASGNKIFKLVAHFLAAQRAGKTQLLSFGGAWSNHLHALSVFASLYQLQSAAIVRGLYVDLENPMLVDAVRMGMTIERVSKLEYSRRRDPSYLAELRVRYPQAWIIPEGGDDAYGRLGMRLLASSLRQSIATGETLVVASGTGATIRGLAMALGDQLRLVSALVVKDRALAGKLEHLCAINNSNFRLFDSSGAGYGQVSGEQLHQLECLYENSGVLLDPLYNGKAWSCAVELAERGERVHLLHTGGIQGWRGFLSRGLLEAHPTLVRAASRVVF